MLFGNNRLSLLFYKQKYLVFYFTTWVFTEYELEQMQTHIQTPETYCYCLLRSLFTVTAKWEPLTLTWILCDKGNHCLCRSGMNSPIRARPPYKPLIPCLFCLLWHFVLSLFTLLPSPPCRSSSPTSPLPVSSCTACPLPIKPVTQMWVTLVKGVKRWKKHHVL